MKSPASIFLNRWPFDIGTTERKLHVSKQQPVNIISVFDDLWNAEKLDW